MTGQFLSDIRDPFVYAFLARQGYHVQCAARATPVSPRVWMTWAAFYMWQLGR